MEEFTYTKILSPEESYCEEHFSANLGRTAEGRFVVKLPLKKDIGELDDSKQNASQRFNNNPDLKLQYTQFLSEYIHLGHMSLAHNQIDISGFFLLHHYVLITTSSTTKLRVVFDASAKTTTGLSLNDLLMVGPNIQDNLFSILIRFRFHSIVLGGDIEKMYRHVLVHEDQR